jgi:hypothetical protein
VQSEAGLSKSRSRQARQTEGIPVEVETAQKDETTASVLRNVEVGNLRNRLPAVAVQKINHAAKGIVIK